MFRYFKKGLKYFFITIISFYVLLVAGLGVMNWWVGRTPNTSEEGIYARSVQPHKLTLLDSGIQSFYSRLELIKRAKKTVDLEFFIFNLDDASRILTQALIDRAQQGVQVRILVDFSAPVFQLQPIYARYLKRHNIEVRYYNTSGLHRLISVQHRSHRKLLIADGESVITGGRNIANEYFDLSKHYNFLDTDIEITGPIAQSILKSFELYWGAAHSHQVSDIDKPLSAEEMQLANEFFLPKPGDSRTLAQVKTSTAQMAQPATHTCKDLSFITDLPNQGEAHRRVFKAIVQEMQSAQTEIVGESPYFVIKPDGYQVLADAAKKGVRLKFLTNGLYSTDAYYTVGSLFYNLDWLAEIGMQIYIFNGADVKSQTASDFSEAKRWGLHSKRAVIDGRTTLIGTYNIDPRSANLNSELIIICRDNPEFAAAVLKGIQERLDQSSLVIDQKNYSREAVLKNASAKQIALLLLSLPLSNLFDFLL